MFVDRLSTTVIKTGGIVVIAAVLGMMVYLAWVVYPLFTGATVVGRHDYTLLSETRAAELVQAAVDEYRVAGAAVLRSGEVMGFDARTGASFGSRSAWATTVPLTASARPDANHFALGFSDGTIRVGEISFQSEFVGADVSADTAHSLAPDASAIVHDAIVQRTSQGNWRRVTPQVVVGEPLRLGSSPGAVRLLDVRGTESERRVAVLRDPAELIVAVLRQREDLATGELKHEVEVHSLPLPTERASIDNAGALLLTSVGDQLYLAFRDGVVARYDLRELDQPVLAETVDLVADPRAALSTFVFMNGEQSLLVGDSMGNLSAWFRVPSAEGHADGFHLVRAHELYSASGALTALAVSSRDKSLLAGDATGRVTLQQMTAEQRLGEIQLDPPAPIVLAQLTPKNDGLFAIGRSGRALLAEVDSPHPGVTVKSLLGRVWYEGYDRPTFTWQSSSGTDDFEPKLSLTPLIFGTLKATLYAMLFAIPVGLGAALYTSEFLDRRTRSFIKPAIEMMAALPSVVLGFIAALVLAPIVENWVFGVIIAFLGVPVFVLAFGYLWQLLPQRKTIAWEGWPRTIVMVVVVLVGVVALPRIGQWLEKLLFAGDFKAWLSQPELSATPGLAVSIFPLVLLALFVLDRRLLGVRVDALQRRFGRDRAALIELGKFLVLAGSAVLIAALCGAVGAALGLDPRQLFMGTYVQRNALIVGFTMGFAVVPIIYTISEDALTAVPASLRSASLGCGATRWQTATRVVLPVAIPGIFSALMVGFGRAVGETMIVLMAAGNTPIIDFNLFNGLRTLSANIAVELPEAVKDGTLYRMLFLAALTLFGLTFVINTLAELVRLRFRRRAAAL